MYRKPHQQRGRYFNVSGESLLARFRELVKTTVKLLGHNVKNPEKHNKIAANKAWHNVLEIQERSSDLRITWLGHASFLIQLNNQNILSDPVFHEISRLTPRYVDPIINICEQLPSIDVVILSHNHPDHMNEPSLRALKDKVKHWLVPMGDKQWFVKRGFSGVREMLWWETVTLGGVTYTFLPAHHWSGRFCFDTNKSLWGSWMVQAYEHNVYFAGDTAYSKHFEIIASHFTKIDYVLMPIGPNEPHSMREAHVSTEEAVQGFVDLNATHFIPMHWGTFKFGADTFVSPLERLHKAWDDRQQHLSGKKLSVLKHGQHVSCDHIGGK